MITKILNIEKFISLFFAIQLGSYIGIQYYEEIEDLITPEYSMKYMLNLILTCVYSLSTFFYLKYYTFKTNAINLQCPGYKWLYYIRYLKNIIIIHTLVSIFFYSYLIQTILYGFASMILCGWYTILYLYISSKENQVITTANICGYTLFLVFTTLYSGFVGYLGWQVTENNLNENFSNWHYLGLIVCGGVFALVNMLSNCIINNKRITNFNMYAQFYMIEQIIIMSCIYSLLYYNVFIRILIFSVLSISLISDRIYYIIIDKYITDRRNEKNKKKKKQAVTKLTSKNTANVEDAKPSSVNTIYS